VLSILGLAILLLSVFVGLATPLAVLIGVVGGVLSFTGLVLYVQMLRRRLKSGLRQWVW
jgi:putative ABC transport system permease protein